MKAVVAPESCSFRRRVVCFCSGGIMPASPELELRGFINGKLASPLVLPARSLVPDFFSGPAELSSVADLEKHAERVSVTRTPLKYTKKRLNHSLIHKKCFKHRYIDWYSQT